MIQNLINKLKSILEANDLLQVVYSYERADSEGTPFATVTPSANENDYATTTENRRVYAFVIRLFVERAGQTTAETAENTMRDLLDSVLDDLDKNYALSGMPIANGYTFLFMEAAPSSWAYVFRENEYRVAEIAVRCHFYVDTTIIS